MEHICYIGFEFENNNLDFYENKCRPFHSRV